MSTLAIAEENTMPKKDFQQVQLRDVEHRGGLRLALNSFAELEKFSHFMALSNFMPKHLRNKQADCLAVLLQALRWEMDPFSVAQKTYFVNDGMAYEAQLVNAIVLSRAQIKTRPRLSWTGEGEDLKCKVSATFLGEDEPLEFEAEMKTITTRNSPLWKQQPKQQLGYFALRAWARLYCPDVLMGIYTKDEMEDASMHIGPDNAIDITGDKGVVEDMMANIAAEKKQVKEQVIPHDPETGEILDNNIVEQAVYAPINNEVEALKVACRDAAGNGGAALDAFLKSIPKDQKKHLAAFGSEMRKIAIEADEVNQAPPDENAA